MTDTKLAARMIALAAALNEREAAKSASVPEDNPYANHTLKDLSHGMRSSADNFPAVNMVAKSGTPAALELEGSRFAVAEEGKQDKSAKRMAVAKQRQDRRSEFEKIAKIKTEPDPERLQQAWLVVYWLVPIVTKIAKSKQRWANRLLGANADDIPQMALEAMAVMLAKQTKFEYDVLKVAAEQLNKSARGIPGDQTVDETEPAERKQIKKARKWLMGMVNNRVQGALTDSYTDTKNLKWENLDIIGTVVASINGVGDDPMLARFKSDRAPAFLGTRFQRPGGVDANALAMALTGAITAKGLDPLVEYLLDDDHRRTDGKVKWSECAQDIFLLTPGGYGQWMWDQVVAATDDHEHGRRRRGIAAREHVKNLFGWMPSLITAIVDAFDPQFIGFSTVGHRAVVASDFELYYLGDKPGDEIMETREIMQPALRYATVDEAATALAEYLSTLTDWKDMVRQ